jgi:hypothetical protein
VITRDTVVVKVPPRITAAKFQHLLEAANSPAASEAGEIYRVIVENGTDPAFMLAVFFHESRFATDPKSMVVLHSTKNWGNTRSSRVGVKTIAPTERGNFVSYGTWAQGADDATYRLIDPEFEYARAGATTISQIIPIWAPGTDGNDPAGYINAVINLMNQWIGEASTTMKDPTNQVNLIPGHAGRGRGGARPKLICLHVQEGTNDLYQEFLNRPAGNQADCTIWSKQDGTLVRLLNDTDTPWTNGDVVGPDMANPVIAGMVLAGVGNTNAYSYTIEHQGFASKGFSDAQVESTAKMCAYWCSINGWQPSRDRIVGHYQVGAHKNCPGPLFPFDKVVARTKELLGGGNVTPTYDPCMEYFNANGGESVFGKPVGGQFGTNGSVERNFEYCHMYLDKASGHVVAEMKDRVNPKGLSVGPGVYSVLQTEGMTALTNEDYFIPEGNKPGLTKRSFTYADKGGVTYRVEAIQDQDVNNKPLPTWTRQIWQFIKEIK